jgi:thiol-disulfide isomerase/thioredoxin
MFHVGLPNRNFDGIKLMTSLRYIGMTILLLALTSCAAWEAETLYREPQPTASDSSATTWEEQTPTWSSQSTTESDEPDIQIAEDQSPAPESFTLVVPHLSDGDLQAVLARHAELATEMGRRPFIEFSAEWCPPCRAIESSLGDPLMVEALRGVYLIRVDIDEWGGQITRSGFLVPGIPLFYELDAKGKSTGRALSGGAWGQDIPRYMAPPLTAFFQANQ